MSRPVASPSPSVTPGAFAPARVALVCAALLASCQKTTTTTTDAASGTSTTTTTISATPSASAAFDRAGTATSDALSRAGDAASAALAKAAVGASGAMARAGDVAIDSALTVKVKGALAADPDVKSLGIDVDTSGGAVTLKGNVPTKANAERAAAIAKGIDGVRSVANRLVVKAP